MDNTFTLPSLAIMCMVGPNSLDTLSRIDAPKLEHLLLARYPEAREDGSDHILLGTLAGTPSRFTALRSLALKPPLVGPRGDIRNFLEAHPLLETVIIDCEEMFDLDRARDVLWMLSLSRAEYATDDEPFLFAPDFCPNLRVMALLHYNTPEAQFYSQKSVAAIGACLDTRVTSAAHDFQLRISLEFSDTDIQDMVTKYPQNFAVYLHGSNSVSIRECANFTMESSPSELFTLYALLTALEEK